MKKVIFSLIIGAALASCGSKSSGGWSDSQKDKFLKPCKDGMAGAVSKEKGDGYCNCVLDAMMKKYKDFDEMNNKSYDEGKEIGKELGMGCAKELLK